MSILNLGFNQPTTHLSCCTEMGDIIYELGPLVKKVDNKRDGSVGCMRVYGVTNIMFLVGGGSAPFEPKDVFIMWDDKKKQKIFEVNMHEPIKNIRAVNDRLVAVLDKKVSIFNIRGDIKLLNSKITYSNPEGICVINNNKDNFVVATLGTNKGEVAIWRPHSTNGTYKTISAHANNIEALAINNNGTLVATASETGTLVKVYETDTCNLKYTFRRGTSSTKIYDLAFNNDSSVLACASANGTIHLFELYSDENVTKNVKSSFAGFKDYLPTYFGSKWSFKQIPIKTTAKTICSFDNDNSLHVASWDGKYSKIHGEHFDKVEEGIIDINNG